MTVAVDLGRKATKQTNQIWCVCCSHEWGVQRHIFLAPGEGPKGQILLNIIKFQIQSQFQRIQTKLCVFIHK